jgi:muramoyltetrapeptide carboxypeptidase LdcA involved in peptidoglycan recycling
VLIVVACAVALHWSAEASRAQARLRLKDEIVKAKNSKDGGRLAGQLEMLFRYVEELREGAFSPFLLQPVVRAMLLPVGGFGGMTLLEHLPGLS